MWGETWFQADVAQLVCAPSGRSQRHLHRQIGARLTTKFSKRGHAKVEIGESPPALTHTFLIGQMFLGSEGERQQ